MGLAPHNCGVPDGVRQKYVMWGATVSNLGQNGIPILLPNLESRKSYQLLFLFANEAHFFVLLLLNTRHCVWSTTQQQNVSPVRKEYIDIAQKRYTVVAQTRDAVHVQTQDVAPVRKQYIVFVNKTIYIYIYIYIYIVVVRKQDTVLVQTQDIVLAQTTRHCL